VLSKLVGRHSEVTGKLGVRGRHNGAEFREIVHNDKGHEITRIDHDL
jgi:hypothetical protein